MGIVQASALLHRPRKPVPTEYTSASGTMFVIHEDEYVEIIKHDQPICTVPMEDFKEYMRLFK